MNLLRNLNHFNLNADYRKIPIAVYTTDMPVRKNSIPPVTQICQIVTKKWLQSAIGAVWHFV